MKVLAALATVAIAAMLGANGAQAADRTARLDNPAITGTEKPAPRQMRERAPLPVPVMRTGLSDIEVERIREAVRAHVRALAARDGESAYRTLTPVIKDHYRDAGGFMTTLARDLGPVVNAGAFAFAGLEREAEDALQAIVVMDAQGREWTATYRLQRQGDGGWAIQGCLVEPVTGRAA